MKNSVKINLGSINLSIEGTPISLENISLDYSTEASVQELATGASFIKDMVNEVKSMIKEAQVEPQHCITNNTPESKPTETNIKPTTAAPKIEQKWDLPAIWGVMMKSLPDGFKKTGIGSYTFETTEEKEKNKITVHIEFNENSIDMDIYTGSTAIHGYLYSEAKRSRISGINPVLIQDMIEEIPTEVREFVKNYFDKVTK